MTRDLCELCIDCDDVMCPGKPCWKTGDDAIRCVIEDKCYGEGCEAMGGFVGSIPILDMPGLDKFLDEGTSRDQ